MISQDLVFPKFFRHSGRLFCLLQHQRSLLSHMQMTKEIYSNGLQTLGSFMCIQCRLYLTFRLSRKLIDAVWKVNPKVFAQTKKVPCLFEVDVFVPEEKFQVPLEVSQFPDSLEADVDSLACLGPLEHHTPVSSSGCCCISSAEEAGCYGRSLVASKAVVSIFATVV